MGIFKVSHETQMFFACETQKNWIKKPQTRSDLFSKLKVTHIEMCHGKTNLSFGF
jgi:hypothetical protein